MTDQYIQVQPNSTGLKIDASELTVGANTVERQRMVIADPTTSTSLTAVKAASTAAVATDPAVVVAVSPNNTIPNNLTQLLGSAVVAATTGVQKVGISGNGGASVDTTLASGTAPTNVIWNTIAPSSVAAGAPTTKLLTSQATSTVIKNATGNLYGFSLYNASTSAGFIQFFNSASVTSTGAILIYPIGATSSVTVTPGAMGIANFTTGITINVSTAIAGAVELTVTGSVLYQ